ncbi:cytochrome b [Pseudomonas fluorescens]|uniref:cytochrome b n=1 Tax=Pseudomonas fluorescens TaxID=294 RepID=UPI001BEB47D4|nr:cytochrome b/b6 domain-containing protein [Pseudomonas fluorescens]MBT2375387.1 cytochrome b/b6 domain-containing protein [Pseudomonas fluorescens]
MTPYSKLQIFLHWFSAAIILWATASGFFTAFVGLPDSLRELVEFFNVSITTVLIPFFIIRIYLALTRNVIKKKSNTAWIALIAHSLIYLTTFAVLVSGVLMMDRDINIFNIFLIPQPLKDPQLIEFFHVAHSYACIALAALLILHLAAVVKHHLAGNPILKRMSW